ncbi:hypothetical protein CLV47_1333 [Antricoccus suffuscus]|uniref:Membrane-anchored protein n=1 Tax=Antricoccus suffuscus TaxID=1629062 RepID=A0A2T0Z023_9ACTN|nr:hypothetical protein [Antricoccus suffuscus]PRZ29494.1 hypothetical protein CLV47_1333 [Antricoccus suffuscus]
MRRRSWWRAVASLVVATIACVVSFLGNPAAAEAHFGGARPSNYHSYIVSISPKMPALSIKTVEQGDRVEVSNPTPTPLVVYGYSHQEPGPKDQYLKISRDGVWVNTKSPAYYLNRTLLGTSTPPDGATDVDAKPVWKKVSDQSTYRWHDHRAHWMSTDLPPQVQAAPDVHHQIFPGNDLYFKYGDTNFTVVVAMDWVPENSAPWWIVVVVAFAAAALVGIVRSWRALAVGAVGLLAIAEVGHIAVSPYPQDPALGSFSFSLASALVPGIAIVGLCALSVRSVARRHSSAYFLLGAAGALAAIQGSSDISVIWSSQLPQTGPAWLARVLIGLVIGLGAGLLVAALLLGRRDKRAARSSNDGGTADGTSRRTPDIASDKEFTEMAEQIRRPRSRVDSEGG